MAHNLYIFVVTKKGFRDYKKKGARITLDWTKTSLDCD